MKSLMTIDIAHPPLPGADAETMLDESLRKIRLSSNLRILKVIHGYGSQGQGGTLKTVTKNWIHKNKRRIISAIDGGDLSLMNPNVQVLLAECDLSAQKDFDVPNEGVTIVWVT